VTPVPSFGLPLLWGLLLSSFAAAQQPDPPEILWEDHSLSVYHHFGWQVDWIGDVDGDSADDYVISSPGEHKVEVFSGSTKSAIASVNGGTLYGSSLASIGDVNSDGTPDFAAGTPWTSGNTGYVDVISGADFSLLYQLTGNYANHYFGWGIAGIGDTDFDGVPDFLVHAYGPNAIVSLHSGATGAKRFEVYAQARWDYFGQALAGIHDYNNDGSADFFVGAPGNAFGYATLFSGFDGTELALLSEFGSREYGASIAVLGEVDGDNIPDFAIGAPRTDRLGNLNVGEVRVYSGATLLELKYFGGQADGNHFGELVAAGGDYNQDGVADLLVASPGANANGFTNAGKVELYSCANFTILGTAGGNAPNENFPSSLAGNGDGHRDLHPDFLAGVYDWGGAVNGRVEMWGAPSPWLQVDNLVAGSTATLTVSSCQAGSSVQFWASRFGSGPSSTIVGMVLLDRPFFYIGNTTAGTDGRAELYVPIPLALFGSLLHCQAVELRANSSKPLSTGLSRQVH